MCGIAGFIQKKTISKKDEQTLAAMANVLQHRGPDDHGFHIDQQNNLAMGHTRLSIIDLEGGHQPIIDGQLALTVNGEFYEYKRLRGQLVTEGFKFVTKSDSELALKLYRKHGLDFVHHLRGEFAIVLHDAVKKRLILVRDRFGIRPLFYHVSPERITYGSEIKALFQHPEIERKIDDRAALHQMMQIMIPGMTLFEGVHAIKPGTMMVINYQGNSFDIKEHQYYDVDFPQDGQHNAVKPDEHVTNVREKMIESIGLRLEADVPVACYLSGGIDSCSILGLASAIQQSPVKAFTIGFDDARYDEVHIAKEMAASCGADQDILTMNAEMLYGKNFKRTLWHAERTFYNTLGVSKLLMSQHVTDSGYKVVITGEGSDEIFGGYTAFKRDMFIHDKAYGSEYEKKLAEDNKILSGSMLAEEDIDHEDFKQIVGFTPSWIQPWILVYHRVKPFLSKEFLERLDGYDPVAAIARCFDADKLKGRHALDKAQYTWIKTMLEGQILNWGGDRVDMANSLESRPAFLDHHVVDYAINIPPDVRVRHGVEKWVVREAMKHILPDVLYKREKFSFMAPPAHTDTTKQREVDLLFDELVTEDNLNGLGITNREKINEFREGMKNETDHALASRGDIIGNHLIQMHGLYADFVVKQPEAVAT